jgi:cold shock CspA family protein
MKRGDIKFYKPESNYGFIVQADAKQSEIFFHTGSLFDQKRLPQAGDNVIFRKGVSRGRVCAYAVRLI